MRKQILFFHLAALLFACNEPEARRPIHRSGNHETRISIDRNRKINDVQQRLFKAIIEEESTLNFVATSAGYWMAIEQKAAIPNPPKSGDRVVFNYKIQSLEGEIIYDEMELGTIDYLVDKEELLPALRYAVKDLSVGEIGTFLMPSFLSYGYQGDGEKIGINQPLRFTIQLKSIKRAGNSESSK